MLQREITEFLYTSIQIVCVNQALFRQKINLIGHHSHFRDVMDQSYPIYACTRANHARYSLVHVTFCGSWMYSLLK